MITELISDRDLCILDYYEEMYKKYKAKIVDIIDINNNVLSKSEIIKTLDKLNTIQWNITYCDEKYGDILLSPSFKFKDMKVLFLAISFKLIYEVSNDNMIPSSYYTIIINNALECLDELLENKEDVIEVNISGKLITVISMWNLYISIKDQYQDIEGAKPFNISSYEDVSNYIDQIYSVIANISEEERSNVSLDDMVNDILVSNWLEVKK